jgi:hypothetical protein
MKIIKISITDSKKALKLILNSNKLTSEVKILFPNKIIINTNDLLDIVTILDRNYIKFSY